MWAGYSAATGGNPFQSERIDPIANDPMRPEYRGLSSDLGTYARTLVGRGATPYSGNFTAPLGANELSILDRINALQLPRFGDGASMPTLSGMAFSGPRDALIADILGGGRLNPASNPYLRGTIDAFRDAGTETLGRNLNVLDAAFGRSGMTGPSSGRSAESIEATRKVTGDVNNAIASILGENYGRGINEQMNVLGNVLPGIDSANLARYVASGNLGLQNQDLGLRNFQTQANWLSSILGANALPRSIAQNDTSARYQEFLRMLQEPQDYTRLAAGILSGAPQLQYTMPQYAPSQFSQILGSAAQVGQAALPFMLL